MKVKRKHREIALTMAFFTDKNQYTGFPNFSLPTEQQIEIFTRVESHGKSSITEEEYLISAPLFNGKAMYDLQILMVHDELADWVSRGWGWYAPLASIIINAYPDRHKCKYYIKFLRKLIKNIRQSSGIEVLLKYTGFDESKKAKLFNQYFNK